MELRKRIIGLMASATILATAVMAGSSVPVASAEETSASVPAVTNVVRLNTTEVNGFTHPALTAKPDALETTREQLIAKQPQYMAYYQAMASTRWASTTLELANLKTGTLDQPEFTFANKRMNMVLSKESFRAYTQAIMYYMTGDSVYRYNALRGIRIWENMDPTQYEYYADGHIHVPVPFYYMLAAAELLQYTSVADETWDDTANNVMDYPLTWTDEDTMKLTENFINPCIETFMNDNTHYLNQHLYSITGYMGAAIFTNNLDMYKNSVEWATVNATTDKPVQNGSLAAQYALVADDRSGNPVKAEYVQPREMGRDNAHSGGDMLDFIAIARIFDAQGTTIDPVDGTYSTDSDAVSFYTLFDNRLLKGTENWLNFMEGGTIPWTWFNDGMGHSKGISQAYRGRYGNFSVSLAELYDAYRYKVGMTKDQIKAIAPHLVEAAENIDSPIFTANGAETNMWGSYSDNNGNHMTELGCEYWLSMPAARLEDPTIATPTDRTPDSSAVSFVQHGRVLDENLAEKHKDSSTNGYISVKAAKTQSDIKETQYDRDWPLDTTTKRGGYQLAISAIDKSATGDDKYLALTVRTNGTAVLSIGGLNDYSAPYQQIHLPNTNGEWRTVVYSVDSANALAGAAEQQSYMDFYAVTADTDVTVDFQQLQYVNKNGITTAVPTLTNGSNQVFETLKGKKYTVKLDVTNGDGVSYELIGAPKGMSIDDTGTITWKPDKAYDEPVTVTVVMNNGVVTASDSVRFKASENRRSAFDRVNGECDQRQEYTAATLKTYREHRDKAEALIDSGSDEEFLAAVDDLHTVIAGLELINPRLADGSFDWGAYPSIVAATSPENINAKDLTDDSQLTGFTSMQRVPFVIDFGTDYAIKPTAFSTQAGSGLAMRSEGAHFYGSNDGETWVRLTDTMTTNTEEVEKINVSAEYLGESFRYLKFQVDKPGVPLDPAYPNVTAVFEWHIFGDRVEDIPSIDSASISSNGIKGTAVAGDTVTVDFHASEAINDVSATINGEQAKIVKGKDGNWAASSVLGENTEVGQVRFSIDYSTDGSQRRPVRSTTDGSVVKTSDNRRLANATVTSVVGADPEDVDNLFDWNEDTALNPNAGRKDTEIVIDLGESTRIGQIELLADPQWAGDNGGSFIYFSEDGKTWVPDGKQAIRLSSSTDWQIITPSDDLKNTGYRYVRLYHHNGAMGFAEVRVLKAQETLTIHDAVVESKTYDGTAKAVVSNVTFRDSDDMAVTDLKAGEDYDVTALFDSTQAGDQSATVNVTLKGAATARYTAPVAYSTQAVIGRKTVTVTVDPATKRVGESDPQFTWTADGLLDGDTLDVAFARDPGEDVGTYQITAKLNNDNPNYQVTFVPGELTITAADQPDPDNPDTPTDPDQPVDPDQPTDPDQSTNPDDGKADADDQPQAEQSDGNTESLSATGSSVIAVVAAVLVLLAIAGALTVCRHRS